MSTSTKPRSGTTPSGYDVVPDRILSADSAMMHGVRRAQDHLQDHTSFTYSNIFLSFLQNIHAPNYLCMIKNFTNYYIMFVDKN